LSLLQKSKCIAKGRGQRAFMQKGCILTGLGFSIWRESRVALATAISVGAKHSCCDLRHLRGNFYTNASPFKDFCKRHHELRSQQKDESRLSR
jgi:hypothetical protein